VRDVRSQLVGCFSAVFPGLSQDDILRADHHNVSGWDSVASVTLFATIEEEFGLELDLMDLPELTSFEKICGYLATKVKS
jgi:acyl carrier protein